MASTPTGTLKYRVQNDIIRKKNDLIFFAKSLTSLRSAQSIDIFSFLSASRCSPFDAFEFRPKRKLNRSGSTSHSPPPSLRSLFDRHFPLFISRDLGHRWPRGVHVLVHSYSIRFSPNSTAAIDSQALIGKLYYLSTSVGGKERVGNLISASK